MFTFSKCKDWLILKMQQIKGDGYETTMSESESHPISVRFRLEGEKAVGEIVVWENGATSMMLYDLALQKYIFDQHNLVLADNSYDRLAKFFEMVLNLK